MDDVLASIGAGLDLFDVSGFSLKLSYDGRFGDHTETHAGSAKLRMASERFGEARGLSLHSSQLVDRIIASAKIVVR